MTMTTATRTGTCEEFAQRLEDEQRKRLETECPVYLTSDLHSRAKVTAGPKYTRVDFGGSGKYMVVNETGEIFGIKAYGVIHRGHQYGTLATIDAWDWSGYTARRKG